MKEKKRKVLKQINNISKALNKDEFSYQLGNIPEITREEEYAIFQKLHKEKNIKVASVTLTNGASFSIKEKYFDAQIKNWLEGLVGATTMNIKMEKINLKLTNKAKKIIEKLEEEDKQKLFISKNDPPIITTAKNWESIEIHFLNDFDVKIYINGDFYKTMSNIDLKFYREKTKDKNPISSWLFLRYLAVLQEQKENSATIQNISGMLGVKTNNCSKIKSNLSDKLKKVFGIKEDPFINYNDLGYYKTKFELKPISKIRGDGELYISPKNDFNDNKIYPNKNDEWNKI